MKGDVKMLITNISLSCHKTNNGNLFISVAGKDAIEYEENPDFYLEVLYLFDGTRNSEEIIRELESQGYIISEEDFNELTTDWLHLNILKEKDDAEELIFKEEYLKYDRQIRNFGILPGLTIKDGVEYQKKLENTSVGILGVGGVGSYIAYGLAAIGIGKLKLVDGDIVELSNTSRQILYNEEDINKEKIMVAAEKLKLVNKKTEIETKNLFVSSNNLNELDNFFKDVDFIVQCADTPRGEIEYLVDDVACNNNIPWITFAPFSFSKISLGPIIIPGETKSLKEQIPPAIFNMDSKVERINERFSPTIMDPYNGMAAKMASIEIVKFLTGYRKSQIINKRLVLDTDTWEVNFYEL